MNRAGVLVSLALLFSLAGTALASPLSIRHGSSTVTIRGVAHTVRSHEFTLVTATKGNYAVDTSPPTHVVESGRTGSVSVVEGAHVGVHGIVHSRSIRAISVRIYPTKPKAFSVRGTVVGVSRTSVAVRAGSTTTVFTLTSQTVVRDNSATLSSASIRTGNAVEVRGVPNGKLVDAIHIHVYLPRAVLTRIHVTGVVVTSTGHTMTVQAGKIRYAVTLSSATRLYSGSKAGSQEPRAGEQVTVYACCVGHPLVAESVHVHVNTARPRLTHLRGIVKVVAKDHLQLSSPVGVTINLNTSTHYSIGSRTVTWNQVKPGDDASVEAYRHGTRWDAAKVHIYSESRRVRSVRGTVTSVSSTSISVLAGGKTYAIRLQHGTKTTSSGREVPASTVRPGDRVRASGTVVASVMDATSIDVKHAVVKVYVLRGTVVATGSTWLVLQLSSGEKRTIHTGAGTTVTLNHHSARMGELFTGIHAVIRGTSFGSDVLASSVQITVRRATESGRVTSFHAGLVTVRRSSGATARALIPAGVPVTDRGRRVPVQVIQPGVYVRVVGYAQPSKIVRATGAAVQHPALDVNGVLVWHSSTPAIRSGDGQTFDARFTPTSTVTAPHLNAALVPRDIPSGARVHVLGTADSSGEIVVDSVNVHLAHASIRARASSIGETGLTLQSTTAVSVRFVRSTVFTQGTHALTAADIVRNDDVTVTGYTVSGNVILAEKVAVHRKLTGFDATVTTVAGGEITVTAATLARTVLLSGTTEIIGVAGTVLVPGMKVHVTGYLRGDGVVLATRVRIMQSK